MRERGTGQGERRTVEAARQPGPGHGQERSLADIREELGRILEQDNQRTHEGIRERLNEVLGRAKPVAREREAHEREGEAPRHGQRVRGHGLGL